MKSKITKAITLFLTFTLIQSCNVIKILNGSKDETVTFKEGAFKYKFIDNQIIIETKFPDNLSRNFLFDLGSPINMVFIDSSLSKLIENEKPLSSLGKNASADGNTTKREYLPWGTLTTNWFELKNSFLSSLYRPDPFACNKLSGMWGASLFRDDSKGKNNKILLIKTQDSTVSVMDTLPVLSSWTLIETDFSLLSHITFKLNLNGKRTDFYFDTGFGGSIIMKRESFSNTQKKPNELMDKDKIYGYITNTLSGSQIDTAYQGILKIDLGNGIISDSVIVISTRAINVNAIGMEFIRRYNVLIDYQQKKLYLQPNPNYQQPKETFYISKGFKARNMNDNNLLIINLTVNGLAEKAGLKVGDQIISVNNIKANEGNNCEVVKLINELDGKSMQNNIIVKRGTETLSFRL